MYIYMRVSQLDMLLYKMIKGNKVDKKGKENTYFTHKIHRQENESLSLSLSSLSLSLSLFSFLFFSISFSFFFFYYYFYIFLKYM